MVEPLTRDPGSLVGACHWTHWCCFLKQNTLSSAYIVMIQPRKHPNMTEKLLKGGCSERHTVRMDNAITIRIPPTSYPSDFVGV